MAVVDGYRLVLRDIPPHALWHGVREVVDYTGFATYRRGTLRSGDEVLTEPSSHVEDAGGMWVSRNLNRLASISVWYPYKLEAGNITPLVSLVEVSWNEADVLGSNRDGAAVQGSGPSQIPNPPVIFWVYRVSALDVGNELTFAQINDASNDISLQVA
jgi:hypothetical protein